MDYENYNNGDLHVWMVNKALKHQYQKETMVKKAAASTASNTL